LRLNDPGDARSLSYKFRARRDRFLREFLLRNGRRILDVGGTSAYWRRVGTDFLERHGFSVTLVNIESSELGDGSFISIVGDGTALNFADGSFDVVHSNSVIEHVGTPANMADFARETRRLAPAYYVQTPNRYFPVDPHFPALPGFHFLPRCLKIAALRHLPIATSGRIADPATAAEVVDHTRLLSAQEMRALFPDAEMRFETIIGLRKSIIATREAADALKPKDIR